MLRHLLAALLLLACLPAQAAVTITWTSIPSSKKWNAAPFMVTATSTGSAPVFIGGSVACSVDSNGLVHPIEPGVCNVTAMSNDSFGFPFTSSRTITIDRAVPSLFLDVVSSRPWNSPFTMTYSASPGLTVTIISTTPATCTVGAGNVVTGHAAGNCSLQATSPADTYYFGGYASRTIALTQAAQTINFPFIAAQVLPAAPITLTATSTSGLPVTYEEMSPTICTVSGDVVTLVNGGFCVLRAVQPGDSNYAAATPAVRSFPISKAAQTITVPSLISVTYDPQPGFIAFLPTSSAGLTLAYQSLTPAVCTVTPAGHLSTVGVGSCTVKADQAGNAIYAPATAQWTFSILKASQSITFPALANKTLADAPFTISATASSGLPVAFASTTPAVCTVSGDTVTLVATGACTVSASQAGNPTYIPAPTVSQGFLVNDAPVVVTLGSLAHTYDATTKSATCTTVPAATTAISYGDLGSGTGRTNAGSYSVTCTVTQAGYTGSATGTLSIAQAPQSINFTQPAPATFATGATFTLNASASSGLPVVFASSTPAVCTVTGATVTLVSPGACTLAASQSGDSNWQAATTVARTVAIAKSPQSITFAPLADRTFGSPAFSLAATASSGLPVSYASTTPAVCTLAGNTVTLVATGACSITADQAGNATFDPAPGLTRSFQVSAAAATATLGGLNHTYDGAQKSASCTTTPAGLATAITYADAGSGLGRINAGSYGVTCTITAANYVGSANGTLTIAKLSQTITFAEFSPARITLGKGEAMRASVSASSGLPVTLVSETAATCDVQGFAIIEKSAGKCAITATQPGDAVYEPAAAVTRSFLIVPPPVVQARLWISASPAPSRYHAPVRIQLAVSGPQVATGTVSASHAGRPLEGCQALALDAEGKAECSTNRLIPGTHEIAAYYSGDGFYLPATARQPHYVKQSGGESFRDADGSGRAALHLETRDGGLGIQLVNETQLGQGDVLIDEHQGWSVERFGDFNRDGRVDLLLRHEDGRLDIAIMDGLRIRDRSTLFRAEDKVETLAIGDFDGDGMDDLLASRPWENGMKVLEVVRLEGGFIVERIAFGIIADGKAYANTYGLVSGDWDVRVKTGEQPRLVIADFDGDGQDDVLFVRDDGKLRLVLLQRGSRGPWIDYEIPAGYTFDRVLDLDGNGASDLLLRGPQGELSVWLMKGLDRRAISQLDALKGWVVTDVADFDLDGADDLLLQGPRGEVRIRLAEGRMIDVRQALPVDTPAETVEKLWAVRDYDGDGQPDLLWRRESDGRTRVEIWRALELRARGVYLDGGAPEGRWVPIP